MIGLQTKDGKQSYVLRGVQTTGGKVRIARVSVLDASGVSRTIMDGAVNSSDFTAAAFPEAVSGAGSSTSPITISTSLTEITVDKAAGAVTYSWEKTDGAGEWKIQNPTGKTTRFSAVVDEGAIETASFLCTVTDGAGRKATASIFASARNYRGRFDVLEP